ncbi:hypothetical protein ACI78T_13040 [Blastococcus sp. SYSU D00922]
MAAGMSDIRTQILAGAADVDAGRADVRPVLRALGVTGLLADDDGEADGGLLAAVRMVRRIAADSLASAFAVWSQRMVLEYLRSAPPSVDVRALQDALRSGEVTGATALAPAIADLAGRGELPVVAESDGDGWLLSGTISWASNLFDDAVVVTPARTPQQGRVVVSFRLTDAGVDLRPAPELLGLNGTGTRGLELHRVAVPRGAVLSDDLADFMALCRPPMLLMQAALAVGLADGSLDASRAHLTGVDAVLRSDHEDLGRRRDDVVIALEDQAGSRTGTGRAHLARTRLDAIAVATDAVALETAVCGGAGYRAGSPTARRVREAAFLPVQAPTLGQLRHDAAG